MATFRFQEFFGDDLEETLDSIKSAPGAFGNILVAAVRQFRLVDAAAFALVVAGWLLFAYALVEDAGVGLMLAALLPTALWLACGIAGGVIFHVGGIGYSSLRYWESYGLILIFSVFGLLALRLALNPHDRLIHRAPPPDL
jgi:FtsH-binding integral membrane protein